MGGVDAEDVAQTAAVRMLEKGLSPDHASAPGFRRNVRHETERHAWRAPQLEHEAVAVTPTEDAIIRGLDLPERGTRAKPARAHTAEAAREGLLAHAVSVLTDWTGREWTPECTAELRDHVGVDEGSWPDDLTLRYAAVAEVDEHRALGPTAAPPTALAAAAVLCGDGVRLFPAELDEGVTPGEVLDRIAAGLAYHRRRSGEHAKRAVSAARVRRPKKKT